MIQRILSFFVACVLLLLSVLDIVLSHGTVSIILALWAICFFIIWAVLHLRKDKEEK